MSTTTADSMPAMPEKKRHPVRVWLWLAAGGLAFWFLILPAMEAFLGLVLKTGAVPLEHGYSLTIYQDRDIWDVFATLDGPGIHTQRFQFGYLGYGPAKPRFIVNKTADGNIGWVVSEAHPLTVLFLIDYRNGDYWFYDISGQWGWDKEKKYLDQIDADGRSRRFMSL